MIKDYLEKFLFFPVKELKSTPSIYNIKYTDVYISTHTTTLSTVTTTKCHGWYIEASNKKNAITRDKVILFSHGNAGNISFRLPYIEKLVSAGFSIMLYDYPGFGLSDGTPNENACIECGKAFYDYLVNEKKYTPNTIILYGESIGGSIASSLANICNAKYLILQSTFTDIKNIIKNIVNISFIFTNIGFETLNNIKYRYKLNKLNKKMKTMIIHSNEDELIDVSNAHELAEFSDKFFICKGSHSSVVMDGDFIFEIMQFLHS